MGTKAKKNTKINQKIRRFFDNDPFDVGVQRVSTQTLSELFHTLGIYQVEHEKSVLLKAIRTLWSEADSSIREDILNFFTHDGKIYKAQKQQEDTFDRTQKIDILLEGVNATPEEAVLLQNAFLEVRSKKITIEKIESKLRHIRFEHKKLEIEKREEGVFEIDDSFEFNASLEYKIYGEHFHKILTLATKPYSYEYIRETELEDICEKIAQDKKDIIVQKQQSIDKFLTSIPNPHPYLAHKELVHVLKASAPKSQLFYPALSVKQMKQIVGEFLNIIHLEIHEAELLICVDEKAILPYSKHVIVYQLDIHVDLNPLLEDIWYGNKPDFSQVLKDAKEEHENNFFAELKYIVDECGSYATLLHLKEEELYLKVYEFALEYLPKSLVITPKISRKIVKIFVFNVHDEIIKRQRQALLARTIRDFKNLFPLAREMRRKLILHIGPTNSGKTYEAMQKLKSADTGYYLAPLRLLALEGYEDLKEEGIDVSLITGEEQLLNADATHISSTIEMLNFEVDVDVCVIDEVQMIDDRDRGWAWANAIIGAPAKEIIMTGSPNVKDAIIALAEYLGEELEIVEFTRKAPLTLLEQPTKVKDVEPATAIIAFSRRDVLKLKQNFSRFFSVSVVYGNLSPEVRREEARRFREKETQILIATDAIAMGMNLPIKTLLFSKADKFDGITQRNLFPSEVHQISGRAGRFGLKEEGFVGALSDEVLSIVKKNFAKEAHKITVPFRVMANLEHIKLVSSILEENSLSNILKFFVKNMEFNGPFHATNLDDMLEAATIVDNYDLDIATKYHLACAPLTLKSPYIITAYESYIVALEKHTPVPYLPPALVGNFAQSSDELLRAEDMVKEISLYLWLSYRFKDYFLDTKKALYSRGILNKFIEESLQQSHFVPRCKICNTPLPMNSKYAICQSCFKRNYTTGTHSKERRERRR